MKKTFQKYLLPGFVFQSIVVGGGYGTGRELVQFFLTKGPLGGYGGMLVATLIWGLILALGFEMARSSRHFDYRTFTKALLGRAWVGFEALYVASTILTIAIVGSASGELSAEMFGAAPIVGTLVAVAAVAFFAFWGSALIERFFAFWSFALYAVYLIMIALVAPRFGDVIAHNAAITVPGAPWLLGGLEYAAYNLAALPAMLFVARHLETRRDAVIAGFMAGLIAMFPGALIYTALLAFYPSILEQSIPANFVLGELDSPAFQLFFQLVLFGTFIETGTGMIHGFNERVAGLLSERGQTLTHWRRLAIAAGLLVASVWLADRFGLIALIERGYGVITYGYWLLFLLPILVVGLRKMLRPA
ncbi:MAG: hypothetical protein GC160_00530 [Acidobacteria bacterium]|nr:hypothetical protein [Acidobacteriota bacterium]